jgi:hypothetical protein
MNPATDLCVIVPSKGRAHYIPRFLGGIDRADSAVDVLLVVCASDLPDYIDFTKRDNVNILVVDDDFTYPMKLNAGAQLVADNYTYLALWNDDHEAITPGWDTQMKAALGDDHYGVAYGPDGIWEDGQVPTAPMLTSKMYTTLGWVALPGLHHILVDNVWMDLARGCGTLHFLPDVRIQHHHHLNGEAELDDTYAETNMQPERDDEDRTRYWDWELTDKEADIQKLRFLWLPGQAPTRQLAPWEVEA